MDQPQSYQYRSLTSPRAIRVIRLNPSPHISDPLSCKLVEISLDKPPKYEALSYTWGRGHDSLSVNDGESKSDIPITKNCHAALARLRRESKPRDIWVDAVCINQADLGERNAQVLMMGDIYKLAAQVVIWLGDADEESDLMFDIMKRMSKLWCFAFKAQRNIGHLDGNNKKMVKVVEDVLGLRKSLSKKGQEWYDKQQLFANFPKRAYWTRMWTLQEYAANKKTILYCGSAEPVDSFFLYAVSTVTVANNPSLNESFAVMRNTFNLHQACAIKALRDNWRVSDLLLDLLCKEASEPRDKIYALKNVFQAVFADTEVDYSAPVGEIYNRATRAIISSDKSLDILMEANRAGKWNVASWALDWDAENAERVSTGLPMWNCSADSEAVFKFSDDSKVISLQGIVLTTITCVAQDKVHLHIPANAFMPGDIGDIDSSLTKFKPFFRALVGFFNKLHQIHGPNPQPGLGLLQKLEALLTIPLRDDYAFGDGQVPRTFLDRLYLFLHDEYNSVLLEGTGPRVPTETQEEIDTALVDCPPGFRYIAPEGPFRLFLWKITGKVGMEVLFYGEGGEMGLSYPNIQVGDIVAAVAGLGNPLVLRPCPESGEGGRFSLIGNAAVTGVMKGEAWPREGRDLRWFDIA